MQMDRRRVASVMGSVYPYDTTTVPPPEVVQSCTRSDCVFQDTADVNGIGLQREPQPVPVLFGAFEYSMDTGLNLPPSTDAHLTTRFEGGRNTPRGRQGPTSGVVQFDK